VIHLVTSVAALALTYSTSAPVPKGGAFYHPTTVGDRWTYQYPDAEVDYVVTKVEEKEGKKVVSVGRVRDGGKVTPHNKVEVSNKGLFQLESVVVMVSFGGGPAPADGWKVEEPPLCLLKLPARPGDKWESQRHPEVPFSYKADRPERVKVPAGEFTAVPVDVVATFPGKDSLQWRYWYAPGVGVVKWTFDKGQGEVVMKSFTPGKD
jgi:hypothetical protein